MTIERIRPGRRFAAAVAWQGTVHVSGQVASDLDADVSGQTRQILAGIEDILAAAGTDKSRILQMTVYLADIGDFGAMNAVWDDWVDREQLPARVTIEARLATPRIRVEISAVAAQRQ